MVFLREGGRDELDGRDRGNAIREYLIIELSNGNIFTMLWKKGRSLSLAESSPESASGPEAGPVERSLALPPGVRVRRVSCVRLRS